MINCVFFWDDWIVIWWSVVDCDVCYIIKSYMLFKMRSCKSYIHICIVKSYVDIRKWSPLHMHIKRWGLCPGMPCRPKAVRTSVLERLVVQNWWGLRSCECFNHSKFGEGLCPVKWYHMHVSSCICRGVLVVLSCHCMSHCRWLNDTFYVIGWRWLWWIWCEHEIYLNIEMLIIIGC